MSGYAGFLVEAQFFSIFYFSIHVPIISSHNYSGTVVYKSISICFDSFGSSEFAIQVMYINHFIETGNDYYWSLRSNTTMGYSRSCCYSVVIQELAHRPTSCNSSCLCNQTPFLRHSLSRFFWWSGCLAVLSILIFSTNTGLVFLFFFLQDLQKGLEGKPTVKLWIHYCVCLVIVDFMLFLSLVDGERDYLVFYQSQLQEV